MDGKYNDPNGNRQHPQNVPQWVFEAFVDQWVEALAGKPPSEFYSKLRKYERKFRECLRKGGYSESEALEYASSVRMFAFEELERIWDNKTWAKGMR